MKEENKKSSQMGGAARTYLPHNCFAWNTEHWHSNKDHTYISCGYCGRITHFAFRSFWLRLRFLFWGGIKAFRGNRRG
jgi:hypothetical protein